MHGSLRQNGVLHLSVRLYGGAQLGKPVKGRSKEKKGSAAAKKDGKTSDEEKRLQESIKRLEMNDYLKKLAVSKKGLLKEFMEKEQKISKMNKLKIQNHWRKIMRLVKVESLRKEVEIKSQNHERDVDRKDAIIQMLDRDLEEAEEQFQMALRSHLLNVDQLIDLQDSRLLGLEKEFENDLLLLEREFSIEKDKITKQVYPRATILTIMFSFICDLYCSMQWKRMNFSVSCEQLKRKSEIEKAKQDRNTNS